MPSLDFTFQKYQQILASINKSQYRVYTIYDYFMANETNALVDKYIILRHDVDGNVPNALKMAKLENSLGITATYYFRMKGKLFNPTVVKQISELGHEVGYHYEHLPDTQGDLKKAEKLFSSNLQKLRDITSVHTVCMHGRPFSKYDSRDFWRHYSLKDFDLVAEPYLNIGYEDKFYFTDTGQAWDNTKFNIRDIVQSKGNLGIKTTDDLIQCIDQKQIDKAAFLIHTNRWVDELPTWLFYTAGNMTVNALKRLLKYTKNRKK